VRFHPLVGLLLHHFKSGFVLWLFGHTFRNGMKNSRQEEKDKCGRDGFPNRRALEFRPNANDERSCEHNTKTNEHDR
jgi:hypothetical protein